MSRRSQDLIMQLGETWGGIAAQQGQRSFEQQAVDYFTKEDSTPENIQKFSEMTGAPIQDVFRLAAGIGQMRERQQVDDVGRSMLNLFSGDKEPTEKDLQALFKGFGDKGYKPNAIQTGAMTALQFKKANADLFKKEGIKLGTGESYLMPDGAGGYEKVASGGEKDQNEWQTFKSGYKDKVNPETGQSYTPDELVKMFYEARNPNSGRAYPIGKEITRDEGDKSITYRVTGYDDKNQPILTKVAEAPRYKPAGSEADKPKRVPYRDTVTGAIHYYDVNNPKDRATLVKFGRQLQAVAENPMSPVLRDALAPPAGASTGKTLDATKAAQYLQKAGGDKNKARKAAKADGYVF